MNYQTNYTSLQDHSFDVLFICALLVFGIAAIYSLGYHQADEHYQIIEFARYKLGEAQIDDLAWEFRYEIRPGFQVFICYLIFLGSKFIGITDPYLLAIFLRLFMGIFAAVVIRQFVKVTIKDISPQYQFVYVFFSYFLWFIPYISVRFTNPSTGVLNIPSQHEVMITQYLSTITSSLQSVFPNLSNSDANGLALIGLEGTSLYQLYTPMQDASRSQASRSYRGVGDNVKGTYCN